MTTHAVASRPVARGTYTRVPDRQLQGNGGGGGRGAQRRAALRVSSWALASRAGGAARGRVAGAVVRQPWWASCGRQGEGVGVVGRPGGGGPRSDVRRSAAARGAPVCEALVALLAHDVRCKRRRRRHHHQPNKAAARQSQGGEGHPRAGGVNPAVRGPVSDTPGPGLFFRE